MHACQENVSSPSSLVGNGCTKFCVFTLSTHTFRGTGDKRSRLFMVRNMYHDPLRSEPTGKHKRTNKQKAILSESPEDWRGFLLPSVFVLRLV